MRKKSILAIESIYNDFWLNCNRNFGVSQAPNPENMANSSVATLDTASLRQFLLDALVRLAYREGDFTLSSGQKSSYYINGKQVTLTAEGALAVGRLLLSLLPPDTQAVAGLTLGADPIVSAVIVVSAYENRPIPALIVRKEAKGHGTMAYIEGPTLNPGAAVVVLEDVVTTALVDREQGGAEFYQSQGIKFQALFSIRDLQAAYQKK
jgi:orotate phosphoribosyltransferase